MDGKIHNVSMSSIHIPIIFPTYFSTITIEALASVALVINNVGFIGINDLEFKSTYDKMIFELAKEAKHRLHTIIVSK